MNDAQVPLADLGDAELMLRVQAEDLDAFSALFTRFVTRAYRVAHSFTRERTRAEDIVQDAFLSIWRSRAAYDPERGAVIGWVMGAVRNRAIDSARHTGRDDSRRADQQHLDECHASDTIEETSIERDQAGQLRDVLARLPAAQREVIGLAYFGELSNTEIASLLAIPPGTVKGRIRLGLQWVRSDLGVAEAEMPVPDHPGS